MSLRLLLKKLVGPKDRGAADIREEFERKGIVYPIDVIGPPADRNLIEIYNRFQKQAIETLGRKVSVNPHILDPAIMKLVEHPTLMRLVREILGDGFILWSSEFFVKLANTKRHVGFHQDAPLFPISGEGANVWLALSRSTEEFGAMHFVPNSHLKGALPYHNTGDPDNILTGGLELKDFDTDDVSVPIQLAPGQASIHHGLLAHGGGPNISNADRVGLVMRFLSAESRPLVEGDSAMGVAGSAPLHFVVDTPPRTPFCQEAIEQFMAKRERASGRGDQIIE